MEYPEKPPPYQEVGQPAGAYQGEVYSPPQYQPPPYVPPSQQPLHQQPQYVRQPAPTVIVQPGGMVAQRPVRFGEMSQNVVCPGCQQSVLTSTEYVAGTCTFIAALVVCLFFWPCAWVPCCIDSTKDVTHSCPNCSTVLGHFNRM